MDDNPQVAFYPCDITKRHEPVAQDRETRSGEFALQIDLTGQICADSIGHRIYSGIGGQMDFIRGAAMSPGGRAIIALPSTAMNGTVSRIVGGTCAGRGCRDNPRTCAMGVTEYGGVNFAWALIAGCEVMH